MPGNALLVRPEFQSIIADCDHILAISTATRASVEKIYRTSPAKITVVHHGCRPMLASVTSPRRFERERPYFVFVGNRLGYKNFAGALAALAAWPNQRPRPDLLVVGQPFAEHEQAEIRRLNLGTTISYFGRVSNADLAEVYRGSVLYSSKRKGFGLPVLEAMSCGTAVIASDCSSLPEVAGHAAFLVDPAEPVAIRRAMLQIMAEPELRERLLARGLVRPARFRWSDTAAATQQVYQHLASRGRIKCRDHIVSSESP